MNHIKLLGAFVFIASFFIECHGLKCYVCTSQNHTACEDGFQKKRGLAAGFLRVCPEPEEAGYRALCRKTHQQVLSKVRIIRDCGWHNATEDCIGSRNAEVVVKSCQCFKDACNAAPLLYVSTAAAVLAGAVRAIF